MTACASPSSWKTSTPALFVCHLASTTAPSCKFSGKPSLKLELPDAQCALLRGIEHTIKEAAVENKATWFRTIKPPPDDAVVRSSFNSRLHQDDAGNYPPSLKVNVNLSDDKKTKLEVLLTRRTPDGKITQPTKGLPSDVIRGCSVVPVLRTVGGVWISVNAKKKTVDYGLVLEATHVMVIEEPAASTAFNLDGVEVAEEEEKTVVSSRLVAPSVASLITERMPRDAPRRACLIEQ